MHFGFATINVICNRVNCSERTAHYVIKSLINKGLIEKKGVEFRVIKGESQIMHPKTANNAPNKKMIRNKELYRIKERFISQGVTNSAFECWIAHNEYTIDIESNILNVGCITQNIIERLIDRYLDVLKNIFNVSDVNFFLKSLQA